MDVLTPEQRRKNMQNIRGRGTKPERMIALGLHARGFRYRLNVSGLPGKPDIVFPKYHAVIFTHGCFWHGHGCHLFKIPATRTEFWLGKIEANQLRDMRDVQNLLSQGWRVLTVWECALRGSAKLPLNHVLDCCETFLRGGAVKDEILGADTSQADDAS